MSDQMLAVLECPNCKKPMTFKLRRPVLFSSGVNVETYRCDVCTIERSRSVTTGEASRVIPRMLVECS
jgi:hypothetical protein